jgi:ABC-type branched-subunit amino acid transport system substrate-binding protein
MLWEIIKATFIFLFLNSVLIGQNIIEYNGDADMLFQNAILEYESSKFVEARSLFNKCIYDYSTHHKTTAAYIMLAKSEYNLKEYKDAIITIDEMKNKFPYSSYIGEGDYISGLSFYRLNKPDTALFLLLKSYSASAIYGNDDRFVEPIIEVARRSKHSINYFNNMFEGNKLTGLVNKAENYNKIIEPNEQNDNKKLNEPSKVANVVDENKTEFKNNIIADEYKIAVFTVPSAMKNYAGRNELENDFIRALDFCINEFKQKSKTKVSLKYISSKQDPQSLKNEIESISTDTNVIAILGPIYSDQFEIAANIASNKRIPIISPTATGNGLSKIGEYVFQANPDFNNRAKSLAIFATKKLNMKNIALFAPNNVYGKTLTESFTQEIKKHGGGLIAQEFYGSDLTSMEKSMQSLIKSIYLKGGEKFIYLQGDLVNQNLIKLYRYGVSKQFIDSISAIKKHIHICDILGKDAESKIEKLNLNTFIKTVYETDDPVYSVDAIYVPINDKSDIKNIADLLSKYKMNIQILGTGDYNHIIELNANSKNMENLISDSDSYFDMTKEPDISFLRRFSEKTGEKATLYSLFAYDALSLILHAIKNEKTNREQLKKFISELNYYQGIHSKITFKWNRVNSYLNILQYKDKKIIKIDEINVDSH